MLNPGDHVIVRGVYQMKAPKPRFPADLCSNTDYCGCLGVIEDIRGDQALVNVGLTLISGETVYSDHKLVFAVGMLEGR